MRHYRTGVVSSLIVSSLLVSGATAQTTSTLGSFGNVKGEIIGAAVAAGAGIALVTFAVIEVQKSHHTLKGCVTTSTNGLQGISDSDGKVYQLSGVTTNLKVGDQVRLHGSKEKSKGSAERTFLVQEIKKDYGPCKAALSVPAVSAAPKTP